MNILKPTYLSLDSELEQEQSRLLYSWCWSRSPTWSSRADAELADYNWCYICYVTNISKSPQVMMEIILRGAGRTILESTTPTCNGNKFYESSNLTTVSCSDSRTFRGSQMLCSKADWDIYIWYSPANVSIECWGCCIVSRCTRIRMSGRLRLTRTFTVWISVLYVKPLHSKRVGKKCSQYVHTTPML